jgi:hypothetical protein
VGKDFWGILGTTESVSGNYSFVDMSGKVRNAAELLSSVGILRSVKF